MRLQVDGAFHIKQRLDRGQKGGIARHSRYMTLEANVILRDSHYGVDWFEPDQLLVEPDVKVAFKAVASWASEDTAT